MTRNEFIAESIIRMASSFLSWPGKNHIKDLNELADLLESEGVAPWKDLDNDKKEKL